MVGMTSTGVVWCSRLAYVGDADFLLYRVKDCCYAPAPVVHEHPESRTNMPSLPEPLMLLARRAPSLHRSRPRPVTIFTPR